MKDNPLTQQTINVPLVDFRTHQHKGDWFLPQLHEISTFFVNFLSDQSTSWMVGNNDVTVLKCITDVLKFISLKLRDALKYSVTQQIKKPCS